MNFFILAGEASGDLHAANLATALLHAEPSAELTAWGGDHLRKAGAEVTKDYEELAIMGFVEIISKLPTIFKNLRQAVDEILNKGIDAVILVDFSGFNLRLAKRLRKKGYTGKIFYYISPKLWVWNAKRVNSFKKYIDAVFCILPFEPEFYANHGYKHAYYIGNPLMDELSQFTPNENFLTENQLVQKPLIALLPGSRSNEINQVLPAMLETVSNFPDYQFVIAGVKSMKSLIEKQLSAANESLPIVYDQTYDLVVNAQAALVTSGTATLETALLGTPLILCYKGTAVSFWIAKQFVNIDYIGLPNLIMQKEIIPEIIQNDLTAERITNTLENLLQQGSELQTMRADFEHLKERVGEAGASEKAAKLILGLL